VNAVCERRRDSTAKLKKMQKQQISEKEKNKILDVRKIKIDFWRLL